MRQLRQCVGDGDDVAAAAGYGALKGRVGRVVNCGDELAGARVVGRDNLVAYAAARTNLLVDGRKVDVDICVIKVVSLVYKIDAVLVLVLVPPLKGGGPRRRQHHFERELRVGRQRLVGDFTRSEDQCGSVAVGQIIGP